MESKYAEIMKHNLLPCEFAYIIIMIIAKGVR